MAIFVILIVIGSMLGITGIVNNSSTSIAPGLNMGGKGAPEQALLTDGINQLCVTYLCSFCYQHKSSGGHSVLDQHVYIYENQTYSLLFFVLSTDLSAINGANLNSGRAAGASSTIYNSFTNPGYFLCYKYNKFLNKCIPIVETYGNMLERSPSDAIYNSQLGTISISSTLSDGGVSIGVKTTYDVYASCAFSTRLTDHHSDWCFICNVGGHLSTSFKTSTAVHFKSGYRAAITVTSIGNVTYVPGWFSGAKNCVNSIQNTVITRVLN